MAYSYHTTMNQPTDPRVEEIAQIMYKQPNASFGFEWIKLKYNVSTSVARRLRVQADAELRNHPFKYNSIDMDWESNAIVPDAHRFIPRNLYGEVEPETYLLTKQSKLNYDNN